MLLFNNYPIPYFLLFNVLLKYFIVGVNLCLVIVLSTIATLFAEHEVKIRSINIIDKLFILDYLLVQLKHRKFYNQ